MTDNENMTTNPENTWVNTGDNPEIVDEPKTPFEAFLYHQRRAVEEAGKAIEALLPDGFKEHGKVAGEEFVKGFKTLVDAAITEIEKATSKAETPAGEEKPSTTGPTKVKVEVE